MPPQPASRPTGAAALSAQPAPARLRTTALALAALALFSMFSAAVGDADTWFHLRTGAYIVQNHKLPVPDPFSWTTYMGRPAYPGEEATRDFNIKHEWLAQVILYLVYAAGGFPGMVLFRAACLTVFCAMVGWVAWRRTGRFYLSLGATMAAGMIARGVSTDRPFVITYLLMAITLWILERRRGLWVLPPLFVFWANAHGGYFMGWVLLGAYCGEALLLRLRKQAPPDEKTLWAASLAAILASGLNPSHFNVVPGLFAYRQSFLQKTLKEWHSPGLWPPGWYSVLLFAAAGVLLWARRRARASDWLLFAVFAAFSLMAQRNVILIGFIAPIVIASYLPEWKRPLPRVAELAVPLVLLLIAGERIAGGNAFQLRVAGWQYPAGPVKFLKQHNVGAPMFNIYEWGGYLMWDAWPLQKTFVDGRALNESVFQDYFKIALNTRDAQKLLDQYGVEVILLEGFEYSRGTVYMVGAALADPTQTRWKLVYQDQTGMVFMRQPPPGVQPLSAAEIFTSYETQCADHVRHQPEFPRCARGLGDLYARLGRLDLAARWLEFYLSRKTEPDPEAERLYQQVRAGNFHAPSTR